MRAITTPLQRTCMLTGTVAVLEIPLPEDEFLAGWDKYCDGAKIQHAFPTLDRDICEFIKTGITPETWDERLKPKKKDE